MLNLSKIQLELDRAKERLRNVEETIQKVEGKFFSNGPVRYSSLKVELHTDKPRHTFAIDDAKNQRRVIAPATDSRIQRLSSDDLTFSLKRGLREKREPGMGLKRQVGDRPQGVFARLSGISYQQADDEDEDDFARKPTLPSRVFTTASEAPSRQEVIAAQAVDEQSKQRNKRMFGALVGTLQKFRKEETRVREREEKRMKVEKKLEEDAKREKEKLMQEKRELFLEKKRREVEIKRIEWSLNRVKEYEAWEANVLPLKNYIQTQAKPHIFYLPSVHNNRTEERLAHSQKIVERMIEKRKTNLKEEIENSEKKAKKTAAEDAEVEEAENIPQENEEAQNPEQMQVDFEAENKENGYLEEGTKDQTTDDNKIDEKNETGKVEENWDKLQELETKKTRECLDSKLYTGNIAESKEELPVPESNVSNNEFNSISEEKLVDDGSGEGHLGKDDDDFSKGEGKGDEKRTCKDGVDNEYKVEKESDCITLEERKCESNKANVCLEGSFGQSKNVENVIEKPSEKEENKEDSSFVETNEKTVENDSELQRFDKKESVSESEPKTEDNIKKNTAGLEKKSKANDVPRRRDNSGSRKISRRSRSPRKRSRSPRFSSRSNRWKTNPRRKRTLRKRSRSNSPPKKSRKSRTPISKRGQRPVSSSKKRSPQTKTRRRSSSRSSSSSSRKRSRSSSSDSSKSD